MNSDTHCFFTLSLFLRRRSYFRGYVSSGRFDKVNHFPLTLTRSREINYGPATTILLVVDEVIKVAGAYLVTTVGEEAPEVTGRWAKMENA